MYFFPIIYISLLVVVWVRAVLISKSKRGSLQAAVEEIKKLPPEEELNTNANKTNFNCITWDGITGEVLDERVV